MNTTTFCGWLQTNPQEQWDLQKKILLYVKFVKRVLENPYSHTHPPYHVGNHGHDLVIMRSPKMLTPNEYDVFFSFLENTVMKNAY